MKYKSMKRTRKPNHERRMGVEIVKDEFKCPYCKHNRAVIKPAGVHCTRCKKKIK